MRRVVLVSAVTVLAAALIAAALIDGDRDDEVRLVSRPAPSVTLPVDTSSTSTSILALAATTTLVSIPPPPTIPTTVPLPETTVPPIPTPTTVYGAVGGVEGPGLYLIDVDGTNLRRLVTGGAVGYLAWSPDGGRIAFTQGSTLSVITLDGRATVLDGNAEVGRDGPSWHPTGSTVAYPASGDGVRDAWIAAADGSVPPRRIAQPSDDAAVAYGPDGRIATMGSDGLFVSDDQGGGRRQLGDPIYNYGQVAWSPDGTRLMALPSAQDNHHVVDVASGATTRIGGSDPHRIDSGAWSPTGTHLVIEAYYYEQDTFGTWLAPADDSAATLLAANVGDPRWARPDRIVAVQQGDDQGRVWELVTLRSDGSDRRSLLTHGTDGYRSMGQPHVSPDGRTIAFIVYEVRPGLLAHTHGHGRGWFSRRPASSAPAFRRQRRSARASRA